MRLIIIDNVSVSEIAAILEIRVDSCNTKTEEPAALLPPPEYFVGKRVQFDADGRAHKGTVTGAIGDSIVVVLCDITGVSVNVKIQNLALLE
jgi:hypothetical protein